eukprot:402940-Amphidinium_carterae.1
MSWLCLPRMYGCTCSSGTQLQDWPRGFPADGALWTTTSGGLNPLACVEERLQLQRCSQEGSRDVAVHWPEQQSSEMPFPKEQLVPPEQ